MGRLGISNGQFAEDLGHDLEINASTYHWSVRVFKILQKVLKVNLKLHHSSGQINQGEIFLFNHFARFETFIPQYMIFKETGAYCRSIASSEFFVKGDTFSNYLLNVGAVPNDMPALLRFLAVEALRGRKIIVFPEGGMVKDRRVIDDEGRYSVYSRHAEGRRKHHTGAAFLGLALDVFKTAVLEAHAKGRARQVEQWAQNLGIDGGEALLEAARRPTAIVPANITFYPIRVGDNMLRKGAQLLNSGLSRRMSEELMIEGNILLKDTDMDIRLGDPIYPGRFWRWWDKKVIEHIVPRLGTLEHVFAMEPTARQWRKRVFAGRMYQNALRVRDEYMHRMYSDVTVNLSHLASCLILHWMDKGRREVEHGMFCRTLYVAVKRLQRERRVHLHRSLRNPEAYLGLLDGDCAGLAQFLRTAQNTDLVRCDPHRYHFLPKLLEEHGIDDVRLENLIVVYANEVAPVAQVAAAVAFAVNEMDTLSGRAFADLLYDDERIGHAWDRTSFTKPRHSEINDQEIATRSGEPYLLVPQDHKDFGVVLAHGFLASPAELRGFAQRVAATGVPVVGVRLKGHGTSPWDLRERSWLDWLESVRRGYRIMSSLTSRVCLVGFSTGAALCLRLAADQPEGLAGVFAASVTYKFQNKNMVFVPIVHSANRLVRWVSSYEGVIPFRRNDSEHPDINYRHMPIRGLYELRRMVEELDNRLIDVNCPVQLVQATDDPVVDPRSAALVESKLGSKQVSLQMVEADKHGILSEDLGGVQQLALNFLESLWQTQDQAIGPPTYLVGEPERG